MDATHRSMVYIALGIFVGLALVNDGSQGASPPAASPAEVALGDSVFHGRVGGALCYVCHGPAGKGVPSLGPDLTDQEWVNGDGTLPFIEKVVEEGIAKPKKMPAPMPPKGGGQLSASQIKAAASYVYSLSHKKQG